jgi:hypothetical protein
LLLELHQTLGYVVLPELVSELLPGDGVGGVMGCGVSIPPICSGPFQSASSIKNLLPVSTLDDVQHFLHHLDPVISLQRIRWVREWGRFVAHELPVPVSCWWWWRWWSLDDLSLHIGDSIHHVGKQLSLGGEKLLHPYRWRWCGWLWLGLGLVLLLVPCRDTTGWSTPDPDLLFTIWLVRKMRLMKLIMEKG